MHLHIRSGSTGADFFIRHLASSTKTFSKPHTLFLTGKNGQLFQKAMLIAARFFHQRTGPACLYFRIRQPLSVNCRLSCTHV
jgi:hypothetical protein